MSNKTENIFEILPFTSENLAKALSNEYTSEDEVKAKFHFKFFMDYLHDDNDGLHAQVIVIEFDYISKSYLQDYTSYYSTCFHKYPKTCKRLHFFSEKFDVKTFRSMVNANTSFEHLWDSYLGYIVVKPLPDAKIGSTILKPYSSSNGVERNYNVLVDYPINIFGKERIIRSLAFMEQDEIVSACATTSLWSAFQKVSEIFQTPLPSPIEITQSALSSFHDIGRILPSIGLDLNQICKAIEAVGLVSELRNETKISSERLRTKGFIKGFIYAYLRVGLPVMLGVKWQTEKRSKHLITLTGYRSKPQQYTQTENLTLLANNIQRFYAHDDQSGPFSRITFIEDEHISEPKPDEKPKKSTIISVETERIENYAHLHATSGLKDSTTHKKLRGSITSIIVPLHPKIRITFEDIYSQICKIDGLLYRITKPLNESTLSSESGSEFVWDIYLDFSNHYKQEIRQNPDYEGSLRGKILFKAMPRYIWIAKAYYGDFLTTELVFDATSINTAKDYCVLWNILDPAFKKVFIPIIEQEEVEKYIKDELSRHYFSLLENEKSIILPDEMI